VEGKKVFIVVGARPNFVKAAPLVKELKENSKLNPVLVHTGQHYDYEMSASFLKELDLSKPDVYLGIGSGTHAEQTGKIMIEFEKVCLRENPDLVIVVGDVNSTIACSIAASKLLIPVAHVEAGLRSFDRTMPEEINRILTDQISDYLFTTCEDANQNLIKEGVPQDKIFHVGNIMVDTLLNRLPKIHNSNILETLGLRKNKSIKKYTVLTLHRPSNVDNYIILKGILDVLNNLSKEISIIFPAHPRTIKMIQSLGLSEMINYMNKITLYNFEKTSQKILAIPPLGYHDFLCLMSKAALVLTDSGGIQEETTVLGIPCLTLRSNTERPVTVREGTNIIVGNSPDKILKTALHVLRNGIRQKKIPKYWDGRTAGRIVKILVRNFKELQKEKK
jgi:UDP-N-acetylglucosamine 2-epimerase (non-hydrolysing)